MKKVILLLFITVLSIVLTSNAFAGPPSVIGDADIVPYKTWELWGSFNYKHSKNDKSIAAPVVEVVYGALPRLEIGVEAGNIHEGDHGHDVDGLDFIAVQPKYLLKKEGKYFPAISAALQLEVPTDDDKDEMIWSHRILAPAVSVGKHFGNAVVFAQLKYYFDHNYDTEKYRYGIDFQYKATKNLKLLAEVYAIESIHSDKKDELNFRLGFKYHILKNAKVFFAAGRSLLEAKKNRPYFESSCGVMFEY